MRDENPPRTLGDYSRPSHEGYRNTIELPEGNNVVPLRSDTIRLFFPPGRTTKLKNDILMFQQHHGESLSEAWTRFKDLLQKVPHHGIDLWLQIQIFYDHVNQTTRHAIDHSAGGKLRDKSVEESWELIENLALYDHESWNDPRDLAKPVKAISLPQDVPSRLSSLGTQLKQQQDEIINKINILCKIVSDKLDNTPTRDILKKFVGHSNVVSHNYQEDGAHPNKGIIKDPSKLFSPKYQAQSSVGEQNRNSSSGKRVQFVNTITIMRKEDEPKETRVLESSAVDNEDRNFVVEDKGTVEKESKDSKMIVKDEESSDIGNDDKTSDLGDKACKDKSEIVEEGEWIEYDQPLDLVDMRDLNRENAKLFIKLRL
ncbi:zinc finger, CCHC-type containing protein [Tanacetum coccineum]